MKKIVLAAGGPSGAMLLAPLFSALSSAGRFESAAIIGEPLHPEIAECFGLSDPLLCVSCGKPARLSKAVAFMEERLLCMEPDLVVVLGSDMAALAAALGAAQLGLPVAAADAGLRSGDPQEQAEMNRRLIDTIADMHFVSEHSGLYNLVNEGHDEERLLFAGNLAIDALAALMERSGAPSAAERYGHGPKTYALLLPGSQPAQAPGTLLSELAAILPVIVLQPEEGGLEFELPLGARMIERPEPSALLSLLRDASMLLTASGELQAEATVMNVPCLTMRERTERPSTLEIGTNTLVGTDTEALLHQARHIRNASAEEGNRSKIPEKWDGAAAGRMVEMLTHIIIADK
ncbi:MAG: UDP-N-acetylglucosamine 2-epimerase [Chlorobium sp.]|nr:UDP-N-acetylglucosamine 2-epimerase [Chlorobium phaeovibrioides]NQU46256.1 UDP-N-acetylglucosamine 2-epimerase [Chlorobium sp.]